MTRSGKTFAQNVVSCRINVLSVACGMEHTLVLCSDGVRLFTRPDFKMQ